jgi:hypothetical protein
MKSTRRGKRNIHLPIFKKEPMGRNNEDTYLSAIQRAVAQMQPEAQDSMGEILEECVGDLELTGVEFLTLDSAFRNPNSEW